MAKAMGLKVKSFTSQQVNRLLGKQQEEARLAAAMAMTGGLPDASATPRSVVESVSKQEAVSVSKSFSKETEDAFQTWNKNRTNATRTTLADAIVAAFPQGGREVVLSDGTKFIVSKGAMKDALSHAPSDDARAREYVSFLLSLKDVSGKGVEFYRETKGGTEYRNFAVRTKGGYGILTLKAVRDGFVLRSVNVFGKKESGKTNHKGSSLTPSHMIGSPLSTRDVFNWLLENQDKNADALKKFLLLSRAQIFLSVKDGAKDGLKNTAKTARELGIESFYALSPSEYARVSSQVMDGRDGSKRDVDVYYTDDVAYVVVRGDAKTNAFVVAEAVRLDAKSSANEQERLRAKTEEQIREHGKRGLDSRADKLGDVDERLTDAGENAGDSTEQTSVSDSNNGVLETDKQTSDARADNLGSAIYQKDSQQKLAERVSTQDALGTDKVRFSYELKNPDGTVFGWYNSSKGEIWLNDDAIDFDTPIHEFTHAWSDIVEREDPRFFILRNKSRLTCHEMKCTITDPFMPG